MAIEAKFLGYCENCGERYAEGTPIRRNREEMWAHETCPDDVHLPDGPVEGCTNCFMVKPCMCEYERQERKEQ